MVTETKKVIEAGDAKQARKGTHVLTVLAVSLGLAVIAAIVLFAVIWS